jgi:aspartate 1-decarboxylase
MIVTMLKGKIHRIKITENNLDYEGSIFIDSKLLALAGIIAHERVDVYNVTNGNRFSTYAVPVLDKGDGYCCVNGAASRLVYLGDTLIVCAYCSMDESEAIVYKPKVVLM